MFGHLIPFLAGGGVALILAAIFPRSLPRIFRRRR